MSTAALVVDALGRDLLRDVAVVSGGACFVTMLSFRVVTLLSFGAGLLCDNAVVCCGFDTGLAL